MQQGTPLGDKAPAGKLAAPTGLFIVIFLLLAALYACGQIHRSAGGVLTPVLNQELGLDARELATIMAGLFLAAAMTQVPLGIFLDRLGVKRILMVMMLTGITGMVLFATADDWPILTAGRILIGMGFSGMFMSSVIIFTAWLPPERLTTWTGRITSVGGAGGLIATAPLAALIEWFGWRSTIYGLAGISLVIALVAWRVISDRPPGAPPPPEKGDSFRQNVGEMIGVLKSSSIRPMLFVALMMYTPMQITLGLWGGPYLLEVHQLDAITRGQILFVVMAGHLAAALGFGYLERKFNSRKRLVITATTLIAAMFALLSLLGPKSVLISVALMVGIAALAPVYLVVTVHALMMFPQKLTGRVVATMTALSTTGVFCTQTGSSFIVRAYADPGAIGSTTAYQGVFASMAGIFLAVSLIYTLTRDIRPDEPRPA